MLYVLLVILRSHCITVILFLSPYCTFIRPHRSIKLTYIYAAYCYRPSGMVCRSVCRPVTLVSPIEMLFGLRARVGPGTRCEIGVQISSWKGAILRGKGRFIVKYRDSLRSSVQKRLKRSRCRLGCGLG